MQRRLPKRGFRVPFPVETAILNLSQLERFSDGTTVDEAALRAARLVQGGEVRIKVLAGGEITKKLTIHAHGFSAKAIEKIEKAGGKTVVVADPKPAEGAGA
jgi:large subunit ribosomal protein L15